MTAPLPEFIAGLLRPDAYPHAAPAPRLIETHISWVILAGDYAYKLKKPLDLGFLDFSSLDKRLACCREEIRLNRRLAAEIYLDVVAITGRPEAPQVGGDGPALEWAVKMRAFPAEATLDREAELNAEQIDAIAERIAAFHDAAEVTPEASPYGSAEAVMAPVAANFAQLRALLPLAADATRAAQLDRLQAWSLAAGARLRAHFAARKAGGRVRECHGDLHLGNIAWVDGAPLIFDAIEFNAGLRHIDVLNEIAFLVMDLLHRRREALAWRCLNRYLEHTGDYAGLAALPYYQVYRALVRAKVAAILASQQAGRDGADFTESFTYLDLADRLAAPRATALVLMHGVSGSGKTWQAQRLLEALGAIRLRSDVERKRLYGLGALARSDAVPGGIYGAEAGARTLARLLELARGLLREGFPVIVDATFIRRDWRQAFAALAAELKLPWFLAAADAPPEILRQRVARRAALGADASEAGLEVLESQLAARESFTPEEARHVLALEADADAALARIRAALKQPNQVSAAPMAADH
ncbi:MAG: AAA family ATPase [Thiobacillaceae bacterium]|nr:AAA family ATPase [Thiobacillaceae bacterium]